MFFGIATAGGTLAYQKLAPTREKADKLVDDRLAAPMKADANDFLYAWESSADYDAAPGLERIQAAVLAINSADDERNPPETGVMERRSSASRTARSISFRPANETRGHLTTGMAKFYAQQLEELLRRTPRAVRAGAM